MLCFHHPSLSLTPLFIYAYTLLAHLRYHPTLKLREKNVMIVSRARTYPPFMKGEMPLDQYF